MTEEQWLTCDDPVAMLNFLQGKARERKLRLLACACARLLWGWLQDGPMKEAVEVGERFADGLALRTEAQSACFDLIKLPVDWGYETGRNWFSEQATEVLAAYLAAIPPVSQFKGLSMAPDRRDWELQLKVTGPRQPALLRDIFGNPFAPVAVDPAWLPSAVVGRAGAAYEVRSLPSGELMPDRLAALADALEEAGCTDADILSHLRSAGPHVRGCWALDLVLGKR